MARKVGQIRWFGDNSANNWPRTITLNNFRRRTIFPDSYAIIQLGIQTLPGTKIYLNASETPIIIGATGIYELSVDGLSNITSVLFDNSSLMTIKENGNAYILIDYIYEETE